MVTIWFIFRLIQVLKQILDFRTDFRTNFRIFERKFTSKRGCGAESCPAQISQKLPKASLDHVFLYDALLLLGEALQPIGQVKTSSVQCRKRNGKSGIWSQGGTLLRNIKNWNQTYGITGNVKLKPRRKHSTCLFVYNS